MVTGLSHTFLASTILSQAFFSSLYTLSKWLQDFQILFQHLAYFLMLSSLLNRMPMSWRQSQICPVFANIYYQSSHLQLVLSQLLIYILHTFYTLCTLSQTFCTLSQMLSSIENFTKATLPRFPNLFKTVLVLSLSFYWVFLIDCDLNKSKP